MKTISEREKVMLQREAYIRGRLDSSSCAAVGNDAVDRYPFPKVTRPRVIKLHGIQYRCVDNRLEVSSLHSPSWFTSTMSIQDVKELYNLITNPTVEVEDDGIDK